MTGKNGSHSAGARETSVTGEASGRVLGCTGRLRGNIPASSQVLRPFTELQGLQAVTMFVHVVLPPLLRGTMWSYVSSRITNLRVQYWQVNLSLLKTLKRENFTPFLCVFTLRLSAMTAGVFHVTEGEQIFSS